MSTQYVVERTISIIFSTENQVDTAVRHLVEQGVFKQHISVMGRSFKSQTYITGFISKRDVIMGGMRNGAIFSSLFGSFFSLLTGVGVVFLPSVGSVIAAGPIGPVLLGATNESILDNPGGGFAAVLTGLGMTKEQAIVYETRLQAGEYVLMVEVGNDWVEPYQLLLSGLGGENIHISETALPHASAGRCNSSADLSPEVGKHLSPEAQDVFIQSYNAAMVEPGDEMKAEQAAWKTISKFFAENENGVWSKVEVATPANQEIVTPPLDRPDINRLGHELLRESR